MYILTYFAGDLFVPFISCVPCVLYFFLKWGKKTSRCHVILSSRFDEVIKGEKTEASIVHRKNTENI